MQSQSLCLPLTPTHPSPRVQVGNHLTYVLDVLQPEVKEGTGPAELMAAEEKAVELLMHMAER